MFYNVIKEIERKYDYKKSFAEKEYKLKKQELYDINPRLSEIDAEICKNGISATKLALVSNISERENSLKILNEKISELKEEKERILRSMNINLKPNYQCPKCSDSGYIFIDGKYGMCSCFKQQLIQEAYNNSNLLKLKNEKFEKFDSSLYSNESNVSKYGTTISPKENIEKIKQISIDFVNNFGLQEQKNLLFSGSPGLGKTFLSSCIANEVLKKGYTVLYQTAPLLFDSIFEYKYNNSSNIKFLYDSLFDVELLIIDDLGTENISNAKFTELFTILNARLLNPKTKTIISTNLSLQDIASMYDFRIISRIIGNYDVCMFFGEDIRLRK